MANHDRVKREYAQLLRLHERLLRELERIRNDLVAPGTQELLRSIRASAGTSPDDAIQEILGSVEEAIRAATMSESRLHREIVDEPEHLAVEGVENLPAFLARFIAERKDRPGFTWEVSRDEVRGWVISWKEYTSEGSVRGFGQFYERPYAWLED